MAYSIRELAALSGVSAKALRHYDEISLLRPKRNPENGYRVYESEEVDRLQAILFYREMGVRLKDIPALLDQGADDRSGTLKKQLQALRAEAARLSKLIHTLEKTNRHEERKEEMSDKEKFEGFKKALVNENETRYGREVRQKYGDKAMDESNAKVLGMKSGEYDRAQALSAEINRLLIEAVDLGDPKSNTALKLCEKHREWLLCYWPQYTKEMHLGLAEGYVADERFAKYYNDVVEGGAVFLRDAIRIYCA